MSHLDSLTRHTLAAVSPSLLAQVVEQTADHVVMTDTSGRILYVNPAFERGTLYSREEVVGRTPRILKSGEHPEDFYRFMWTVVLSGEVFQGVVTNRRRDGEIYFEDQRITPIRDDAGKITHLLATGRDITDRVEAEQALRDNEEKYREMFMESRDAMFVIDRRGRILDMNRAGLHMLGCSADDLSCLREWEFYADPGDRDAFLRKMGEVGSVRDFELRLRRHCGAEFDASLTATTRTGSAREVVGYHGTVRDVTESNRARVESARAQKLEAIGQLAAGIAHEINTPTQYVGDNTRFLQDVFREVIPALLKARELTAAAEGGPVLPQQVRDLAAALDQADVDYVADEIPAAIQQSLEGIERVTRIVRAMKEFSHPGQEKTALDLNTAIDSTITVARNEWKYVAELVADLEDDLPPVTCVPGELNQVILNMIVNAAHAIADAVGDDDSQKGVITVTTRRVGELVEICIADSGKGMPEEVKDRIFDPFFTTKEVGKGTGQGLSLAHTTIVDGHGGSIKVDSKLGVGTTFTIRLPFATIDQPEEDR